jgi:hypothetical protein
MQERKRDNHPDHRHREDDGRGARAAGLCGIPDHQ